MWEKVEALEDHPHLLSQTYKVAFAAPSARAEYDVPGHLDLAGRWSLEQIHASKEGAFAGATGADDADMLACAHLKIDSEEYLGSVKLFLDSAEADDRVACVSRFLIRRIIA
jgi:hypothetical protein